MVNVKDEKVSIGIGSAVAYSTWMATAGLFVGVLVTGEVRMVAALILAIGIAATATVRTYFVEFSTMVRRAFELDHESVTTLPSRR